MAQCLKCGADLASSEVAVGVCYPCEKKLSATEIESLKFGSAERLREEDERLAKQQTLLISNAEYHARRKAEMILTTETYPAGLEITDRIEIVTAECVFGMNVFRDFFAEVTDIVGGRSGTTQKVFREARKTVLDELREEAYIAGGNAVIGVSIQYSQLAGKGSSMLMVTATGTAVLISKN
jgi:uncharacterized protein YbjQ (UPF0145 family)